MLTGPRESPEEEPALDASTKPPPAGADNPSHTQRDTTEKYCCPAQLRSVYWRSARISNVRYSSRPSDCVAWHLEVFIYSRDPP